MKPTYVVRAFALLLFFFCEKSVHAEQFQQTSTVNNGNKQTFSLTLTQTHGVSSSASMTPDYLVNTTAVLKIGPNSSTVQQTKEGSTASMVNSKSTQSDNFSQTNGSYEASNQVMSLPSSSAVGTSSTSTGTNQSQNGTQLETSNNGLSSNGVSGLQTINYDNGTEYSVIITPRKFEDDSWKQRSISQASGQATGITTSSLSVESTSSAFVNNFVNTLTK